MHLTARSLLLVLFILSNFLVKSQSSNYPPNSSPILQEAIKFYTDGKYKQAIDLYKKVSKSDSNYSSVLNNLSLCYYMDSNFNEGYKMASEGLKLFPEKGNAWYNLIANNLVKLEKKEEALATYDKAIKEYNFHYLAWYNKGVIYYNQKQYEQAKKCFQQCALINPYYSGAHFYLGEIAYNEGNVIPALLSYTTSLLSNPESNFARASVKALSSLSEVSDDVAKNFAARKTSGSNSYEMIEEIFTSKIALDKKYKLTIELEDPIVRQLQVVFEKLEYDAADKDFSMQYYVPLYTNLFSQKQFEPMVYYIFSGLNIKDVQNYIKKNKKKIEDFSTISINYLSEIRETQTLNVAQRKDVKDRYLYSEGTVYAKGKLATENGKAKFTGPWEFYYDNGRLKSKGLLNEKQEKIGEWQFFHANGRLNEKTNYANNKATGKTIAYFDNGIMSSESSYNDGELNGTEKKYYYNGFIKEEANYIHGKKNGLSKEYSYVGYLTSSANYKDDKLEGKYTIYHSNGKVSSVVGYVNDEAEGPYKSYYVDGTVKQDGEFKVGKRVGLWKEVYNNGKQKSITNYVDGEIEGDYKDFYDNGEMMTKAFYVKSKLEGKFEDFDRDGKLFSESNYEKGRLRELKFFDKTGTVISNSTSRNGSGNLVFFDGQGNKTSEGYFTKEGLRNGKTTYYYRNGKVSSTANFKEGVLKGEKISYYPNGQVSVKTAYEADEEIGFNISYHENGTIKHEGKVEEGYNDGIRVDYDELGNKASVTNYKNRDLEGCAQYFHPNGKLEIDEHYFGGWLTRFVAYDTTGKISTEFDLPNGNASYELKNYNGSKYITGTYNNYLLEGEHKTYFPDGSPYVTRYYKNGVADGVIKKYYFGGKLEYEGQYKMGEKDGTWNYYHENGKINTVETFSNGRINGVIKSYTNKGTLDKEITYLENQLDGTYKYYGDNNQLALVLNYSNNKLISYSYEDKLDKLVPDIPLKKGSGLVTGFYKNGTKSAEISFEEDEGEGIRKIYTTSGKLLIDGARTSGYDHGVKKIYYANGQLEKEENYYYGSLHGKTKQFYENGKIESEENWYNGNMHGECKYYDNTGKQIQTRKYYYGTLVTVK
ncbi:MAG: tetratricopeptide repeat protein [Segetibacter sp.]|nr:tetratricopeptide repeat protein [Segetibacter sp.]